MKSWRHTVSYLTLIISLITLCSFVQAEQWQAKSPSGNNEIQVRTTKQKGLEYRVLHHLNGKPVAVLDWSPLGLSVQHYNQQVLQLVPVVSDFSTTLHVMGAREKTGVEEYTMVTGKRLNNRNEYNELIIETKDSETQLALHVYLRAFNNGVAFRYFFPEKSNFYYQMTGETTGFNIGTQADFWGAAYDFSTIFHPSYETEYMKVKSGTSTPKAAGVAWGFPVLINKNNIWALLHESNLDQTYHGSHLKPVAKHGLYTIALPTQDSMLGFGRNIAASTLPWAMPWRFLAVSEKLSDIVESNLVFDLAAPQQITDTAWIKPGTSSWSWWSDHASSTNKETLKDFIDFSAEMGWPYSLVDANWNTISENIMQELTQYAATKNVGLMFWYNSGGRHNNVGEQPRNIMDNRERRRAEFAKLQALGVKGLKVDFFHSDKQDMIQQYIELMTDAAEYKLMINFHGSTIPRGWERTYPNLMTMEAVRGSEFYSFEGEQAYGKTAPYQNTIHPFLRNVIGSMDYTPVAFSAQAVPRITTNAHEAALAVVYESGIQHIADSAKSFSQLPTIYRDYFKTLPTVWDETYLLSGTPGDHAVLARRSGKNWYIAGINGGAEHKKISLDLSRLSQLGGQILWLKDNAQNAYHGEYQTFNKASPEIEMAPYGGFVLRVTD